MIRHELTTHGLTSRLVVALLASLAMLVAPAPAYAHAHLKRTSPASGARLNAAPTQLVLTFSEAPALAVSALRLLGPDSAAIALGDLTHDAGALTITARIAGALTAGRYTVLWQTAGDDGHVQHGSFQFTVAEGATGLRTAGALSSAAAPDSARRAAATASQKDGKVQTDSMTVPLIPAVMDVASPLYVAIRWLQFLALLTLIGAVAFRWWLLPRAGVALDDAARSEMALRVAAAGWVGAWALALSALARLVAQVATTGGVPGAELSLNAVLIGTAWGHGWLLEIFALIVVIFALRAARGDASSVGAWRATATAVAALAFVPAFSGHAVAERSFAPFTLLFDAAHVLSAGAWLGGLAVMLIAALPLFVRAGDSARRDAPATMVNAFSPLALVSAGVLVFTGIVAARLHVGSWGAFTTTGYGRTLLVKLALVILLVLVATWNWLRARPRLATDPTEGARALTRSATIEVAIAAVILLVTAILVALPTPVELVR